jgi:hypothetical protein
MSLVVEPTLPYSPQELKLDDPDRWSRLFPLMRPSTKIVESSNSQIMVIDTALSNSTDILIAAVASKGNYSNKILSESSLAAFTVEKVETPVISAEEFATILKENGFPVQDGLVVVRSGMKQEVKVKTESQVLEVSVQGEVGLHHVLSLLSATKPEVK